MDFEKIEQAYTYLLENVQVIQSDLATSASQGRVAQDLPVSLDEGRTN